MVIMSQQLTSLSAQRGASVTSIILLIIVIVIASKLMIAIVPAQIGDYQFTKTLSAQLHDANTKSMTAKQFIEQMDRQLSINADYETKVEDRIIFTSKKIGQLAIRKHYVETHNFFANVDIVSRFEGDIEATQAK